MTENERMLLLNAGWFEGREVDVTIDVSALEHEGHTLTEAAFRILKEFSELEIRVLGNASPLWIDGLEAARVSDPGWCHAYAVAAGVTMTPVGGYSHMTVLVDQWGTLWGGFDHLYGEIGDTMLDMVREQFVVQEKRMLERELPR